MKMLLIVRIMRIAAKKLKNRLKEIIKQSLHVSAGRQKNIIIFMGRFANI